MGLFSGAVRNPLSFPPSLNLDLAILIVVVVVVVGSEEGEPVQVTSAPFALSRGSVRKGQRPAALSKPGAEEALEGVPVRVPESDI